MKVIIAWDGDHIGREVGRASLADDVEGLRRISQSIDLGNNIWKSWVENNGGSIISFGGDEGRAEILAEKLGDLPKVREQYSEAVDASVSVGVGTKLSEADKALMAAKFQGGNRIVLYSEEVEEIIEQAQKQKTGQSEADKLSEEYLNKGDQDAQPAPEAQDAQQAANAGGDNTPAPPEATHGGADMEDMFHSAAQEQTQKDQGQAPPQTAEDQVRAQVVQVLQQLKEQAPTLEQLKQAAPDTYQTVMAMTQAVIAMARQLNGDPAAQTSLAEVDHASRSDHTVPVPQEPDDKKDDKGSDTKKSEQLEKNRPTPTFPKMGVPDNRRETPIVNDAHSLKVKQHAMTNSAMRSELYDPVDPNHKPIAAPAGSGIPEEQVWQDWGDNHQGIRDHMRERINRSRTTQGAANVVGPTNISYSKGKGVQEVTGWPTASAHEQGPVATQLHEDLHLMMSRIQERYGMQGRHNLVENMLAKLKERDPEAYRTLDDFHQVRNNSSLGIEHENEERLAILLNYLNNPDERKLFHQHMGHSADQAKVFGNNMKRAHHELLQLGQQAEPTWSLDVPDRERLGKSLPTVAPSIPPLVKPQTTAPNPALKPPSIAPLTPPPAAVREQAPAKPQMHNTVEGFMGAFKALPKGGPERGKLITSHMNHGPFLAALQQHPEGKAISSTLNNFLNSSANAGVRPGKTQVTVKSEKAFKLEGDAVIEVDPKTGKSLGKGPVNKADQDPSAHDPKQLAEYVLLEQRSHSVDHASALERVLANLGQDPDYYKTLQKEIEERGLDKAALNPVSAAPHHHLNLPVGTKIDPSPSGGSKGGEIKVQHDDGKTSWVSARAGMVMSPDGHAVSSRNPQGR